MPLDGHGVTLHHTMPGSISILRCGAGQRRQTSATSPDDLCAACEWSQGLQSGNRRSFCPVTHSFVCPESPAREASSRAAFTPLRFLSIRSPRAPPVLPVCLMTFASSLDLPPTGRHFDHASTHAPRACVGSRLSGGLAAAPRRPRSPSGTRYRAAERVPNSNIFDPKTAPLISSLQSGAHRYRFWCRAAVGGARTTVSARAAIRKQNPTNFNLGIYRQPASPGRRSRLQAGRFTFAARTASIRIIWTALPCRSQRFGGSFSDLINPKDIETLRVYHRRLSGGVRRTTRSDF